MPRTGKPATRRVAAVERAVALLDALADGSPELGTNELARRTGLHPSSVSRLLATLAAAGLVEHVETSGRYRLGLRLLDLGNAVLARLDLREVARPHLRALVEATGETATLSAPGDPDAFTVDFVQSASSVQSVARLGRPSIAHATATGKVTLAYGGIALPPGRLERFTARTKVERAELEAEVEQVRVQGWARAVGEREEELNALAAPVRGSRGELAAILGLQGPASRFGERGMARALDPLLARARAVSNALGWRGPDEEAS
ncbi:MAG: IclR family transcriptional regulator [Gaiellaceae bacterium]